MLQFRASVGRFELPIDFGVFAVSFFFPGGGFIGKRLFVGKSAGPGIVASAHSIRFQAY
jgi:hypothetical protein